MTMEQDQGRFLLSLSQPGGARKILFTLPLSFCQLIPIGRTVVNRLEGPGYSLDSNGREEVHGRGLLCFKEKTLLDFIFCLLNHLENKQLYSQSQREESQPSLFHMAQKLFFAFQGRLGHSSWTPSYTCSRIQWLYSMHSLSFIHKRSPCYYCISFPQMLNNIFISGWLNCFTCICTVVIKVSRLSLKELYWPVFFQVKILTTVHQINIKKWDI